MLIFIDFFATIDSIALTQSIEYLQNKMIGYEFVFMADMNENVNGLMLRALDIFFSNCLSIREAHTFSFSFFFP